MMIAVRLLKTIHPLYASWFAIDQSQMVGFIVLAYLLRHPGNHRPAVFALNLPTLVSLLADSSDLFKTEKPFLQSALSAVYAVVLVVYGRSTVCMKQFCF
jgi:hypothetical protein